ncbi:MAG: DUF4174 domain-containing protein [Litorimonas sp.]
MIADDILGNNRIVVLCNGSWTSQKNDPEKFEDRDIAMVEIKNGSATFVSANQSGKFHFTPLADAEALVRRTACNNDKEFVLIGKDTGVKQRWKNTLPLQELYSAIDAMPMRQYEMKTRGAN